MAETTELDKGKTYNDDVLGIVKRIDRVIKEVHKAASANVLAWREADRKRIDGYIKYIVGYKAWATSQPEIDVPETHPEAQDLPALAELAPCENESIDDVLRQLKTMRAELVGSQSNRLPNSMFKHDVGRFDSYIAKLKKYLTEYVDVVQPLDMPESSPGRSVTGSGL